MPRTVVYTCLFGDYEELNEQRIADRSETDFICFTDRTDLSSQTWEVRSISTLGIGPSRESRRPKLLPHLYLGEYDQSCYIDNSVILKTAPAEIFSLLDGQEADFLCVKHPWRNCVFDEAEEVIRQGIDDEARVREQMDHYRKAGFPSEAGLIAGTFLLRRHNAPNMASFGDAWFAHVLRFSKRDQLSFPFVAHRLGLRYAALDLDLRSNRLFDWPTSKARLPRNYDPDIYLWLNPDVVRADIDPATHYKTIGKAEGRRLQYHRLLDLNRLANKYRSDKGNLYYNRHFYTRVYEHYLSGMKKDRFTLFEIGLLRRDIQARSPKGPFHDAPSLRMWADYFPNAQVHGFDIQNFSSAEGGRITITRGDQSDRGALGTAVARNLYPLRVIVDDGSHASHDQQVSLSFLFRHLAPGGLYFIEDLTYQPAQFERPHAQKTRDMLRCLQARITVANEFIPPEDMAYLRENIASIEFHDSMDYQAPLAGTDSLVVIRKR